MKKIDVTQITKKQLIIESALRLLVFIFGGLALVGFMACVDAFVWNQPVIFDFGGWSMAGRAMLVVEVVVLAIYCIFSEG